MITKIEKFGATWCGPCKALDKTLDQLVDIQVVKYDVEEHEDLAEKMGIRNVPVMFFYDENNQVVDKLSGAVPLTKIQEIIKKYE